MLACVCLGTFEVAIMAICASCGLICRAACWICSRLNRGRCRACCHDEETQNG